MQSITTENIPKEVVGPMPTTWFVVRWTLFTEGLVVDKRQESWFDGREDAAEYTDEIVAKFKGMGQRLHIWTETVIV